RPSASSRSRPTSEVSCASARGFRRIDALESLDAELDGLDAQALAFGIEERRLVTARPRAVEVPSRALTHRGVEEDDGSRSQILLARLDAPPPLPERGGGRHALAQTNVPVGRPARDLHRRRVAPDAVLENGRLRRKAAHLRESTDDARGLPLEVFDLDEEVEIAAERKTTLCHSLSFPSPPSRRRDVRTTGSSLPYVPFFRRSTDGLARDSFDSLDGSDPADDGDGSLDRVVDSRGRSSSMSIVSRTRPA